MSSLGLTATALHAARCCRRRASEAWSIATGLGVTCTLGCLTPRRRVETRPIRSAIHQRVGPGGLRDKSEGIPTATSRLLIKKVSSNAGGQIVSTRFDSPN